MATLGMQSTIQRFWRPHEQRAIFGGRMAAQLALFGRGEPEFDRAFTGLQRIALPPDAWVEYVPNWLAGQQALFDRLLASTRFRSERRVMYERVVEVPRLYAVLEDDGPKPPIVSSMQRVLSERYGEVFSRASLGYYRNGQDSVAFHGDYVARNMPQALVATVSLGAARRFLMRPVGGGKSLSFSLGEGDLLVMGGSCQRTWQHAIPKSRSAGDRARIALMLRPEWLEQPNPQP